MNALEIRNLHVGTGEKEILKGLNLSLESGTVQAIMGPNGSGKSTLANVLMGHPGYEVTSGEILLNGESMLGLTPDERARKGMFLAFQYPSEIAGVKMTQFLRTAGNELRKSSGQALLQLREFRHELDEKSAFLQMDHLAERYLNEGFSGGEKKRSEILQMMMLKPSLCILDEIDSGLDVDAMKTVAQGISAMRNPQRTILMITHYTRILHHIKPDRVHLQLD
ncbi:MAG: Fe-S cluster assembly ATPase SufC, partial [Candidatus Diapherotrites archaeon]|nr:Fe-S cluster assembly ATPase SufC [Candidatus Diapherotrites archaeon]